MSGHKRIGITGGIGSGKSTVSKVFGILGVPIYDADSRAKWLMVNNEDLKQKIIKEFGNQSYLEDGSLNKKHLSSAFSDPSKLEKLNSLVHPAVGKDFDSWAESNNNFPYVLKEAALMFESGSYKLLDQVITVFADEELRISRILKRDPQREKDQVLEIISRQMDEKKKLELADYVIFNNEKELITLQVLKLHARFVGI